MQHASSTFARIAGGELIRSADTASTHNLRRRAAIAFGLVMLCCAVFFCWELRNQYSHASPPALFLACPLASAAAAWLGWKLGPVYGSPRRVLQLLTPVVVVGITTGTAAVLYATAELVILRWTPDLADQTFRELLKRALEQLPQYFLLYILWTLPIWAPGMLIAHVWLRFRVRGTDPVGGRP
jgi:hypothetical protein